MRGRLFRLKPEFSLGWKYLMTVEIREIVSRNDLKEFIHFPLELYRGSPYYVPLLNSTEMFSLSRDKNPAFEHCLARYWMAYKDGRPVGRIAAILNRLFVQRWEKNYLRFGWLDFIDDTRVSEALFRQVEDWAAELEMEAVHGPLGFSVIDREGMLVEGFDQPSTAATLYNYPYYPLHMDKLGYTKDNDWVEFQLDVPEKLVPDFVEISEATRQQYNLHLHEFLNKEELLYHIDQINEVMNSAYDRQYGVVPLSSRQLEAYVDQYFGFMDMEFVPAIMDENDRLIAFAFTLPSLTSTLQKMGGKDHLLNYLHFLKGLRWNNQADLYHIMVHPDFRKKGVPIVLVNRVFEVFRKHGIRHVESNPEQESHGPNVIERWGCYNVRQHKRRRVYIKKLDLD